MQGVTKQVSTLKISTACITVLKINPDTRGVAPSLLRMRGILLHTVFDRERLIITTVQCSSVAEITRPRYLKEVIISRGHP